MLRRIIKSGQDHFNSKRLLGDDLADNVKKAKATHSKNQSISNKKPKIIFQFSQESIIPLFKELKAQHQYHPLFKLPRPQEELSAPAAHHQVESEAAVSNEAQLHVIHFLKIKLSNKKVKQFQAGCIKNHFSEWTSYTMGKMILGSVSGLSLGSSDNKLPHYHQRWK